DVAKDVAEIAERGRIEASEPATVHSSMSKLVVALALLAIDQHAVSLGAFLELLLGFNVSRIAVRMVLHGQLTVSALDLLFRRGAGDTQHLVVIAFCLCRQISPNLCLLACFGSLTKQYCLQHLEQPPQFPPRGLTGIWRKQIRKKNISLRVRIFFDALLALW